MKSLVFSALFAIIIIRYNQKRINMTNKIQTITKKQGFTIIEVVLVLAIAGLIFLMVFIALPNMQRSQRDTQRRNDYSALSSAITQFTTNNNGKLPADSETAYSDPSDVGTLSDGLDPRAYINSQGTDPNGLPYKITVTTMASGGDAPDLEKIGSTSEATHVYVVKKANCVVDPATGVSEPGYVASSRAFAIYGNLETGNGTYCQASAS